MAGLKLAGGIMSVGRAGTQAMVQTANGIVASFMPAPRRLGRSKPSSASVRHAGPTNCACCGSAKLSKLGEEITRPLRSSHVSGRSSRRCGGEVHLPRV